jgi:hypothetical protein
MNPENPDCINYPDDPCACSELTARREAGVELGALQG